MGPLPDSWLAARMADLTPDLDVSVMRADGRELPLSAIPLYQLFPCHLGPLVGLGGSVGCAVRLETRRSRVQTPPPPLVEIDHEIFSTVILFLPLIQEGQLPPLPPPSHTPEVGNILSWRLIMKYFLRSFSSFR